MIISGNPYQNDDIRSLLILRVRDELATAYILYKSTKGTMEQKQISAVAVVEQSCL
jgi:hypothetical protein